MPPVPFRFTKDLQAVYLEHVREGQPRGVAADLAFEEDNVERRRLMRKYIEKHPNFEKRVLDAEKEAAETIQRALYCSALGGNVSAAKAWLELTGIVVKTNKTPAELGKPETPRPDEESQTPGDPFADLDNVTVISPRKRREQSA